MPDLQTSFLKEIKCHIISEISEQNQEKYNINLKEINLEQIKKQLLYYYKNELKFYASETNKELYNALSDIKGFFNLYSYKIVEHTNKYISLNESLNKLININSFNHYVVNERYNSIASINDINNLFCNMVDNYIFKIFRLLLNYSETNLTNEEIEEISNLPTFCIMVREKLLI
jgi:hypothetical protein